MVARIRLLAATLLVAGALPPATPAQAQPANLVNAKTTARAVAPGALAAEVRALAASAGPAWIGWTQPVIEGKHRMCCFSNYSRGRRGGEGAGGWGRDCCGGCHLEKDQSFTIGDDGSRTTRLEGSRTLVVLLRAERGRIGKVRAFDDECALDAGGLPFLWLTGVKPEEGVAFLGSLVRERGSEDHDEDAVGPKLAAIALTGHPSADAALEGFLARGQPRELRKKAAFWIGNARGRRGFEVLRAVVPEDPDSEFREKGTFALSQSPAPEAVDVLIGMAKRDPDGDVRGQALFWLAQRAGEKAAEAIHDALRDDPNEEVKKKAVFALSQLPRGEAVTELIRVARTNRNREVRKQAIFWLGQSKDPRALEYIEEVLRQ